MGRESERFPVDMQRSSVRTGLRDSDNRPDCVEYSPPVAADRRRPSELRRRAGNAAPVNRERISRLAHADHPIASPLDDDSVRRLLEQGIRPDAERVLDLGCGGGEWLLRATAG
ncbi:hypothetical protein GCM10010464_74320 [Pseudonocardia yunnanensis]